MCVCVCICMCVCARQYARKYAFLHVLCIKTNMCVPVHVYIHMCVYINAHISVYTHAHMCVYIHICIYSDTACRRPIRCPKLQVIFRKRATNHRALLRDLIYMCMHIVCIYTCVRMYLYVYAYVYMCVLREYIHE